MLWIGTSGWQYRDWRPARDADDTGYLYPGGLPQRLWLEHYAERFATVEVNSTFYRLPRRDAVARWGDESPDHFVFAGKVSRYLTHIVRLRDTAEHLQLLLDRIEPLVRSPKLGPLLWQLPP